MSSGYRKVLFRLAQDGSGYPPASVEGLWARPEQGGYRVDSIPFHVYGVAPGDLVAAREEGADAWFEAVLHSGGGSVFRVIVRPPETLQQVQAALVEFGCVCEAEKAVRMLAVHVLPEQVPDTLLYYLVTQREAGVLDFEEGVLRHRIPDDLR